MGCKTTSRHTETTTEDRAHRGRVMIPRDDRLSAVLRSNFWWLTRGRPPDVSVLTTGSLPTTATGYVMFDGAFGLWR